MFVIFWCEGNLRQNELKWIGEVYSLLNLSKVNLTSTLNAIAGQLRARRLKSFGAHVGVTTQTTE